MPTATRKNEATATNQKLTPFVKWAGGKSRLLPRFFRSFPTDYSRYYEPFLGGGAVFLALQPQEAKLSDLNPELVNCWQVVRDFPEALIEDLDRHSYSREYFYEVRSLSPGNLTAVERASRFIFLNKTCYNGLYRVNRAGRFNVPFGRHARRPTLYDRENLYGISRRLQGVEIVCSSFEKAVADANQGDFVYFDPPYHPLSKTSNFTSYTEGSFSREDQALLANVAIQLHKRGCVVAVSNSDTREIRSLFRSPDFRVARVMAARAINSKAEGRGKIAELLIYNYEEGAATAMKSSEVVIDARGQPGTKVRQGTRRRRLSTGRRLEA
jgi:DNA adenine methylase